MAPAVVTAAAIAAAGLLDPAGVPPPSSGEPMAGAALPGLASACAPQDHSQGLTAVPFKLSVKV